MAALSGRYRPRRLSPGGGLSGRGRAVHADWPGEVNQTAGTTETSAGGPGERDVGVLRNTEFMWRGAGQRSAMCDLAVTW